MSPRTRRPKAGRRRGAGRRVRGQNALVPVVRKPGPARWNVDPQDAQRSVARLVLSLVEFLRQLMERQAIRRMDEGTLSPQEIEDVGQALMRLEETLHEMARHFGLRPDELNLDLGPLGKLT